jgi:hypothetical protein
VVPFQLAVSKRAYVTANEAGSFDSAERPVAAAEEEAWRAPHRRAVQGTKKPLQAKIEGGFYMARRRGYKVRPSATICLLSSVVLLYD